MATTAVTAANVAPETHSAVSAIRNGRSTTTLTARQAYALARARDERPHRAHRGRRPDRTRSTGASRYLRGLSVRSCSIATGRPKREPAADASARWNRLSADDRSAA